MRIVPRSTARAQALPAKVRGLLAVVLDPCSLPCAVRNTRLGGMRLTFSHRGSDDLPYLAEVVLGPASQRGSPSYWNATRHVRAGHLTVQGVV